MKRLAMLALGLATGLAAAPKILLVANPGESHVALGLTALGVEYGRTTPGELRKHSPFAYDIVFSDREVSRYDMARDAAGWREFVRLGGVFIGFRTSEQEGWLPSPLTHDRGYGTGALLAPDHPLFTTPHTLDLAAVRAVHAGSIYHALSALGEGWTPLVEAGAPLGWDKREAKVDGPHYGMAELKYGKGRILLLELIPAYNWFHDEQGKNTAPGAKLFENIVTYALASATEQAAKRPAARPIPGALSSLRTVQPIPERPLGIDMAQDWVVTSKGPYTTETDFRGVRTFLHADSPSQAGNFIQASTVLDVPTRTGKALLLQWYQSDTYCGGNERILGGAKHGQTSLKNFKAAHRFKQVLVNNQVVWEEDVLGRNVQPARERFQTIDIAPFLPADADRVTIAVRVEDRKDSGELPFFIEVFFARIALLAKPLVEHPLLDEKGVPASTQLRGLGTRNSGDVEFTAAGRANWPVRVAAGTYRAAVQIADSPDGNGRVRLLGPDGILGDWELTANDGRDWWLLGRPMEIASGQLQLVVEPADTRIVIRRLALVPQPPPAAKPTARKPEGPVSIRLQLGESAGVPRDGISTQTVPLPEGLLRDPDQACLRDATGAAVPIQTRPVARWADGSIKILLVNFPARLDAKGGQAFVLQAPAQPEGQPTHSLGLHERGGTIEVDTGAIRATISTTNGRLLDSVERAGKRLIPRQGTWDLVLVTEGGDELHADARTVTETNIVERGPLRALIVRKGWFAGADGAPTRLGYRIQTEFFAGSDEVRVQTFLVNRDDASEIYLKRWSMELAWSQAGKGAVLLPDREAGAGGNAVLYQHREDQFTWTGEKLAKRATGNCQGLVRLPGLSFGTRWFWQRFPQAIRFAPDRVVQDFIPAPFDDGDLPTEWAKRMAEMTDKYQVGGVGYPQSPGKMGLFRLARGEALRQETLFRFTDDPAPLPALLAALDAPFRAHADAKYVSTTRAYGQFHRQDTDVYPTYEKSVEAFLTHYLAKRKRRREYGFENYGDDTFEWGYGPSYTYWSNSEYDHHHGFALQYLRSGEKRWWDEFEKTARQCADVVVIHHEVPGSYPQKGGPHHHNATAMWMPSHERQGWVADHTCAPAHSSHAWAEGMVDYWFLTGDPWAEDVVREMTDWYVQIVAQNRYGAGGQERGPGWALVALSALVRATNDPRTVEATQSVANWIISWQDPVRGVVSVPISEQPSYEGGTVFMHGIVGRGLGRWYDVSGDPRVRDALLGIADWLVTEPMGQPARFWYKQAPDCMGKYSATDQTLNALAYAYSLTGEPRYGEVAGILLASCGASVRGMSWFPQVLDQLLPLRQPVLLSRSASQAVTTPNQPAMLSVDIRNTTDSSLAIHPALALPDGFQGNEPAPFSLSTGETRRLDVAVSNPKAGQQGTAQLSFSITEPDGTAHQRQTSFAIRSVNRLERRSLAVADATLHPPMVLVGKGPKAYIGDPRPADFKGSPFPADGADGGHAVWTVDVPEETELTLWAEVKWLDEKGNSFHFRIDDQPETVLGNIGKVGPWIWVKGPTLRLAHGQHTLRVRSREEGAQLGGLWLTTLADDAPPPARK